MTPKIASGHEDAEDERCRRRSRWRARADGDLLADVRLRAEVQDDEERGA